MTVVAGGGKVTPDFSTTVEAVSSAVPEVSEAALVEVDVITFEGEGVTLAVVSVVVRRVISVVVLEIEVDDDDDAIDVDAPVDVTSHVIFRLSGGQVPDLPSQNSAKSHASAASRHFVDVPNNPSWSHLPDGEHSSGP